MATPTPTLSSDDLRTLSPAAISELKNEGPVGKVSATTTESVSDKESVFSEAEWLSSDSQSVQPIFSTQSPSGELSPVTPPSTSSQSTQAPYTPSSTPSPLLLTPSPSTLVTPLQNMSLSQLSGASLPLQVLTQVMIPWIESPSNFVVSRRTLLSACTLLSGFVQCTFHKGQRSLAMLTLFLSYKGQDCLALTCYSCLGLQLAH